MTPQLFERAGRATFGPSWHLSFAIRLNVRPDTVKAWAKGRSRMPPELGREVAKIMLDRYNALSELRAEVVTAAGMVDDK